jgi:hypothetical protein
MSEPAISPPLPAPTAGPMMLKKRDEAMALLGGTGGLGGILGSLGPIILQIFQQLLGGLLGGTGGICGAPKPIPTPTPADYHEFLTRPNRKQAILQKDHRRQAMRDAGIQPRSHVGVSVEWAIATVQANVTMQEMPALIAENKPA